MRLPGSDFRKFASILLVAFGLTVFASVFHHHEDGRPYETCPLCVFKAYYSGIALQDGQQIFQPDVHLPFSWEIDFTFLSTFHSPFLIRAPPA